MSTFEYYPWALEMVNIIERRIKVIPFDINSYEGQLVPIYQAFNILGDLRMAGFEITCRGLNYFVIYSRESKSKGLTMDNRLINGLDDSQFNFFNEEM